MAPFVTSNISVEAKVEAVAKAVSACISHMPDDFPPPLKERLGKARATLQRREISIVVAGLFKAGKSTLINRLARWDILPSGGLPETGAPALLRRRKPRQASVIDRAGRSRTINADPAGISAETSLYDSAGARRSIESLAARVEVSAPGLRVNPNTILIDLPGLRDTPEMDEIALDVAMEADLILWVFRSEPAFSEQDAEFLGYLVETCGSHVVQLVLNVFGADPSKKAWRHFQKDRLAAHRTALRKLAPNMGLSTAHVDQLCVVDARRMRRGLFGVTYGGRTLFKLLASASNRNDAQVKRARYVRVALAAAACRAWLEAVLGDVEASFADAEARWQAYAARLKRRDALAAEASAAVETAFSGLDGELDRAGDSAAAQITKAGYSPGASVSEPLHQEAFTVVANRAGTLAASLAALGADPEAEPLGPEATKSILRSFSIDGSSGDDPLFALRSGVENAIGDIALPKPKWSFGRVASWFKGEDKGVEEAISEARSELRGAARSLAKSIRNQKAAVRAAGLAALRLRPIEAVARPDPQPLQLLQALSGDLAGLDALLGDDGRRS